MPKSITTRPRNDPSVLPSWIRPRLSKLADAPSRGQDWLQEIAVESKLARGDVQQPLDDKHPVLTAGAAIGRDDRKRGEDRGEPAVIGGQEVRAEQRALAVERHGQAVRI